MLSQYAVAACRFPAAFFLSMSHFACSGLENHHRGSRKSALCGRDKFSGLVVAEGASTRAFLGGRKPWRPYRSPSGNVACEWLSGRWQSDRSASEGASYVFLKVTNWAAVSPAGAPWLSPPCHPARAAPKVNQMFHFPFSFFPVPRQLLVYSTTIENSKNQRRKTVAPPMNRNRAGCVPELSSSSFPLALDKSEKTQIFFFCRPDRMPAPRRFLQRLTSSNKSFCTSFFRGEPRIFDYSPTRVKCAIRGLASEKSGDLIEPGHKTDPGRLRYFRPPSASTAFCGIAQAPRWAATWVNSAAQVKRVQHQQVHGIDHLPTGANGITPAASRSWQKLFGETRQ